MISSIYPFCKAFDENKDKRDARNEMIYRFLRVYQCSMKQIEYLYNDTCLNTFIEDLFFVLCEENFPNPSEGPIPSVCLQILQFLTHLSTNNPLIMEKIAKICPFDIIPTIFFGRMSENGKVVNPQGSHILSSLRFLASVSFSDSVFFESIDSLNLLVSILTELLDEPSFASLSCTILSGLYNYSEQAKYSIESISVQSNTRRVLIKLLKSEDSSTSVSALAFYLSMIPFEGKWKSCFKKALSFVFESSLAFSSSIGSLVIKKLSQIKCLNRDELHLVLQCLMNLNGNDCYHIAQLLCDIVDSDERIIDELCSDSLFVHMVILFLKSEYDFVSYIGSKLVCNVLSKNSISDLECSRIIIGEAFDVIANKKIQHSYLKQESCFVFIRHYINVFLKKDNHSAIATRKDDLILRFRHYIDVKQYTLCIHCFKLFLDLGSIDRSFIDELFTIVTQTQFIVSIVDVLKQSSDRVLIQDCIDSLYYISNGLRVDIPPNNMVDIVYSFFYSHNNQIKEKHLKERESFEKSIFMAKEKNHSAEITILKLGDEIKSFQEKQEELKGCLAKEKLESQRYRELLRESETKSDMHLNRINEMEKLLENSKSEILHLENELSKEKSVSKASIAEVELLKAECEKNRKRVEELEESNKEYLNKCDTYIMHNNMYNFVKDDNSNLRAQVLNLEKDKSDMETNRNALVEKLNNTKAENATLISHNEFFKERYEQQEIKIKSMINEAHLLEEQIKEYKEQISHYEEKIIQTIKSKKKYKDYTKALESQLAENDRIQKDQANLKSFIHRITEKIASQNTDSSIQISKG